MAMGSQPVIPRLRTCTFRDCRLDWTWEEFNGSYIARVPDLTGATDRAAGDIAGFGLMLVVGLLAFREQKLLVDVMIDEVPRQYFFVIIGAIDEIIGIGQGFGNGVHRLAADFP